MTATFPLSEVMIPINRLLSFNIIYSLKADTGGREGGDRTESSRVLPVLALNEIHIGESLSSRVSYLEMQIDKEPETEIRLIFRFVGIKSEYFCKNLS